MDPPGVQVGLLFTVIGPRISSRGCDFGFLECTERGELALGGFFLIWSALHNDTKKP
jgi:hypothetical protein